MKYLKKYNESTQHYSIYNWFEDLKSMQWGDIDINVSELKKWSHHFIGKGVYERVSKLVDDIFDSVAKVDTNYINDRLLEVWDELPLDKEKYIMLSVAYGDYENYNKKGSYKYNGLIPVTEKLDNSEKLYVIIHIIKNIIYPTLFIGSPSIQLRTTDEQLYVTDEKWNCLNFDIDNYDINEGDSFNNSFKTRRRTTTIYKSDIQSKKSYDVDKVINMYVPCLLIEIGGHNNTQLTGSFKLSHIEKLLEDVLDDYILSELNYKEVIWDYSKGERMFSSDDDDFNTYTLKILLK